ncbi:MAG TPA: hypothetical protein PK420_06530 [Rubrivivax sp.]|nr:hypothetical protein [Rubrivivax sp.]
MTARKPRPRLGSEIEAGMSVRDMAAAIGVAPSELHRWMMLARLPDAEFQRRLTALNDANRRASAAAILAMDGPVPARGRVQRAQALVLNMTATERGEFFAALLSDDHFIEWLRCRGDQPELTP